MLLRKMFRDLKLNMMQFLSIFIMTAGAMFITFGFAASNTGSVESITEYLIQTNYKDLDIQGRIFNNGDIDRLSVTDGIDAVDGILQMTGKTVLDKEYPLVISYISGNTVSKMFLKSGEEYSEGSRGIWIDATFAEAVGLNAGDTLDYTIDNSRYSGEIKGLVYSPEYLYYVPNSNFTEPEYGSYGFLIMDIREAPVETQVYSKLIVDLRDIKGQGNVLTEREKAEMNRMASVVTRRLDDKNLMIKTKSEVDDYRDYIESTETTTYLAVVFTVLFMSVASLGIVSTMARLTDKQRIIIGAMKALGFSREKVTFHYLSYAASVTLGGAAVGAVLGTFILGSYLNSINDYYYLNPVNRLQLNGMCPVAAVIVVLLSALVSFACTRKLLMQNAADILRPEPPQNVGNSFVEKLPFWNRLKFAVRWNIRDVRINLFRTLASVAGILMCSMLIFAAAGFYKNIDEMPDWKYEEQTLSTTQIMFEDDCSYSAAYDYLKQYGGQLCEERDVTIITGNQEMKRTISIPDEGNLFLIQDDNRDYLTLPEENAFITYKTADELGVKEGDEVSFRISGDSKLYTVRIVSVCRLASNQGILLSRNAYEKLGGTYAPNILYSRNTIPSDLKNRPEVYSVESTAFLYETLVNSNSIGYTISIIMIIMGSVMGIVVLYNLGILSYTEKRREIATLKVLGFQTISIREILMQQNLAITAVGALLGIPGGIVVLYFLVDVFMGGYADMVVRIGFMPYIVAVIGTFAVSALANIMITARVKNIDMVDALKGVE